MYMFVFRENSTKTPNLTRTNQNKFKAVTCTNYDDAFSTTIGHIANAIQILTHTQNIATFIIRV